MVQVNAADRGSRPGITRLLRVLLVGVVVLPVTLFGVASWLARPSAIRSARSSSAWKYAQSASLRRAGGIAPPASAMRSSSETIA